MAVGAVPPVVGGGTRLTLHREIREEEEVICLLNRYKIYGNNVFKTRNK